LAFTTTEVFSSGHAGVQFSIKTAPTGSAVVSDRILINGSGQTQILNGPLSVGSTSSLVAAAGDLAFPKVATAASAPGAGNVKIEAVAGTNAGTCKLIMYAGTSNTPVTIVDNVGAGC